VIRIALPLAGVEEPLHESTAAQSATTPRPARGGRALIVDDSPPARELLRAMLELSGWHTQLASGGSEALRWMASEPFDLILLDYQMPDADGAETAVALRKLSQTRRLEHPVYIYLLTANLFAHEQLGKLPAINGVLAKPLSRATLLDLLSRIEAREVPNVPLAPSVSPAPLDASDAPLDAPLDADVLEDLRALTGRDGQAVLPRVVAQTRTAQEQHLQELSTALDDAQWDRAAQSAHAIAGQAAMVGAHEVARQARALQGLLEGGSLGAEQLRPRVEALLSSWRHAERALQQELVRAR